MGTIRHNNIQKEDKTPTVDDIDKKAPVPHIVEDLTYQVPQWQIDMVREIVKRYKEHPEEFISWDDFWKKIDAY